ncbi:MAG TPA: anti-sigma factor [Candidatus Limnocylindrales bacterium]|nr:anti-sigma factor [Candidatus Limnocylindrales bacterium]
MTLSCDDVRDLAAGFVLGALPPDEAAAVREHLATCPEAHEEIAELGGVVPYLAESLEPVEPPVSLKARLLAAAEAESPVSLKARLLAAAGVEPPIAPRPAPSVAPAPTPFPGAEARDRPAAARRTSTGEWTLRIAAVLAIVALGAWNLQLQSRLDGAEGDLAAAAAYQQGVARVLEVAVQPGATTAIIAPAEGAPTTATGFAASGPDGTVVISMRGLDPTVGTEVYEAWVIVGDAAPVPLGGFVVGEAGTGVFSGSTALAEPGAILALTLEPAPGATTPTEPVLTVGALGGASG